MRSSFVLMQIAVKYPKCRIPLLELFHIFGGFVAENVNPDRVQLNICYKNENLKEVYKELFDD